MKEQKPKSVKKRFLNSWITSLVSISMILVLLGLLAFTLINAQNLSNLVREKIGFTLVLKESLPDAEIVQLQKQLENTQYVKSTRFIHKDQAARELEEELGDSFVDFLGYNPLFSSLDVKLHAPYTENDSLFALETYFRNYPQVENIYYQKNLVSIINRNVRKITVALFLISALLTFIFFGLINNTIRILIYSQRFTINTMQMVGANNSYIRKPFLQRSLALGAIGGIIANSILASAFLFYRNEVYRFVQLNVLETILLIAGIVFVLGFVISFLSTWFAVNKFLRLKFDELFY